MHVCLPALLISLEALEVWAGSVSSLLILAIIHRGDVLVHFLFCEMEHDFLWYSSSIPQEVKLVIPPSGCGMPRMSICFPSSSLLLFCWCCEMQQQPPRPVLTEVFVIQPGRGSDSSDDDSSSSSSDGPWKVSEQGRERIPCSVPFSATSMAC